MVKGILKHWQLLLIVILLIACFSSMRSCSVNEDRASIAVKKADSSCLVAKYYRDKNGDLVGQVKTHELTLNNLKEYGDQLGFDKKVLQDQVGNMKNLVAYWKGKAGVRDTVETVLHDTILVQGADTVRGKSIKWKNKYLTLDGTVFNDTLRLSYLYNVDFSLTAYRKPRGGFWKPPGQLVTDIRFSDPNFKVDEFKGFVITEPRKRWYQTTGFKIGVGFVLGSYATWRLQQN